MVIVKRFLKDSINSMQWELIILEYAGKFALWKSHTQKRGIDSTVITEKLITKNQAEKYEEINQQYHVETYSRPFEKDADSIFN